MKHLPLFLAALLFALAVACNGLGFFRGEIATDPQYLPPGTPAIDSGVEIVDEAGFPTGRNYVVVPDSTVLPPEAPVIDPEQIEAGDLNAVATGVKVVTPFLPPWLQPFAGLAAYAAARMFGKRYRQNWGSALKNAAKGDLAGAGRMALAAEGVLHTTEDPAVLKAVAAKKAAVEAAAASVEIPAA